MNLMLKMGVFVTWTIVAFC